MNLDIITSEILRSQEEDETSDKLSRDIISSLTIMTERRPNGNYNPKFKHCDLLSIKGKVDSFTAPDLIKAIEALNNANRFKIILDLSKLEYMSSAGFRALLLGQRNCKRL